MIRKICLLGAGVSACVSESALAGEATTSLFHRFEVGVGVDAAGPLMFRDPPDARLEAPTVFQYGGRLGFRFGTPDQDPNRLGLELGWHGLAHSDSRQLNAFDPLLVLASGGATEVQVGAGARIALADAGFTVGDRVPFTGPMASLQLRHAFLDEQAAVPVGVSVGGFVEAVLGHPADYTSVFAGARFDFTFRKY